MSKLSEQVGKSQGLLAAAEAVTNRRAFVTLFCTFALMAILMSLGGSIAAKLAMNGNFDTAKFIGVVGTLFVLFAFLIGTSATGFLLNDLVRGREQKSIGNALLLAVATVHRLIGVLLLVALAVVGVMLTVCLLLWVCKVPGVGPLLFAAIFPACAILLGFGLYALTFVVGLHGPAIWEGNTVFGTVSILGTIAQERLFSVIIQTLLLSLLVGLIGALSSGAAFFGLGTTSGLSSMIIGYGADIGSLARLFSSIMTGSGDSDGAAYLPAGMFGVSLVMGMAITAPFLSAIAGNCVIFANVTENLSTAALDQKLQGAMDAARAKAEQTKRQLDQARAQLAKPAPVASVDAPACPKCGTTIVAGDMFCGGCGHKLG